MAACEAFWLGDCGLMVQTPGRRRRVHRRRLEKPRCRTRRACRLGRTDGHLSIAVNRRANCSGARACAQPHEQRQADWAFAPDARAARHVCRAQTVKRRRAPHVAGDGRVRRASHRLCPLYGADGLMPRRRRGLRRWARNCAPSRPTIPKARNFRASSKATTPPRCCCAPARYIASVHCPCPSRSSASAT